MPELPFFLKAFKRGGMADIPTTNMLVEMDEQGRPVLIARPGLEAFVQVGTAPIRGVFQKQGLFDDDALVLASQTLYRVSAAGVVTAFSGAIPGDGLVVIDGGLDADGLSIARIANGTGLYLTTGLSVAQEDFPDDAGVTSVTMLAGYWLATQAETDFVYYLEPASTSWTALEFAAAEYRPDHVKVAIAFGEIAGLMGDASTEFWRATGDATSQLEPIGGLKWDIGCRAASAVVNCRGTLIWVDNDCAVRMTSGGEPAIITDNGLAEQIRRTATSDLRASFVVKDQHPLYVLTLGNQATWIYDLGMKAWTKANSAGLDFWRADLFCNIGDVALARDALSNQIYRLDPDLRADAGVTFTREFCAFLEARERGVPIANLELHCEKGGAPRTGQGSNPKVVLQVSLTGTRTWGPPKERGLGASGEYQKKVRWAGLGTALAPQGAWFKFAISDPVVTRVSAVAVNVP